MNIEELDNIQSRLTTKEFHLMSLIAHSADDYGKYKKIAFIASSDRYISVSKGVIDLNLVISRPEKCVGKFSDIKLCLEPTELGQTYIKYIKNNKTILPFNMDDCL